MSNPLLTYDRRRYGMDHDRYDWSMLQDRPPVHWPGDKPLALWINVSVQHFPLSGPKPNVAPAGALTMPYPDLRHYTLRDYGNRVGIYRVLAALEHVDAVFSLAVSGQLAQRYPALMERLAGVGGEWLGHGWNMNAMHAGDVPEDQERQWIEQTLAALAKASPQPISGWFSPGRLQTPRTPELLAELGLGYHCDWVNDELPYAFSTAHGSLTCLPSCLELDDVFVLTQNLHSEDSYCQQVIDAADLLIEEATRLQSGRLLSLNLHPWLLGQPHRVRTLRELLDALLVRRGDAIWNAQPSDIISAARAA